MSLLFEALALKLQGAAVFHDCAHDLIGCSVWNLGFDFQRDADICANLSCQVGNDFLGDTAGIAPDASGVKVDRAVEELGLCRVRRGRDLRGLRRIASRLNGRLAGWG
jgi:hypothetical protein